MSDGEPGAASGPLLDVLRDAQERGFVGSVPVGSHVEHAVPLLDALPSHGTAVDLGTGGGVPGLILALGRPSLAWVFVETQERRARWLEEAARRLGLGDRVEVRWERAEVTGRGPWRGAAVAVTARSFAAPPVTAECGAPLLRSGASLWVAEPPPPTAERWPAEGLARLGLAQGPSPAAGWVRLEQRGACPDRFPRRPGLPAKRPLF